jgi:Fic family protein
VGDEGYQPFPDISVWTEVPFDSTTYDQYAALLEQARADATEDARDHAVRTAIRYAGTDTGAIEGLYTTDRGFTRTVAIEAAHWEVAARERGPNAAALIKDQIEAYEWLLDLVTESRPISEHVIRELHTMLCRSQDTYTVYTELGEQTRPLPKGEYKSFPNNPTSLTTGKVHHYASPDMVAPEVHRLVASLSTDAYRDAHPVVQASFLHYSLVAIHPFADGNGRATRALASVPLYRALRVPLTVLRDERDEYLDALGAADEGDLHRFTGFVAERVVDTIDLVVLTLRAGRSSDQARSIEMLRRVVTSVGGNTHTELDAIAQRLLDATLGEISDRIAALPELPGISFNVSAAPGRSAGPAGYREPVTSAHAVQVRAESSPPATAVAGTRVRALIATDPAETPFILDAGRHGSVGFALRDLQPAVREVAKIKIASLIDGVMSGLLASLTEQAEASLRRDGYRG